jgi:hypothetical protein
MKEAPPLSASTDNGCARYVRLPQLSDVRDGSNRGLVGTTAIDAKLSLSAHARFGHLRLAGASSNFPMMDWNESRSISNSWVIACARCVHREIKENLGTTIVSS